MSFLSCAENFLLRSRACFQENFFLTRRDDENALLVTVYIAVIKIPDPMGELISLFIT